MSAHQQERREFVRVPFNTEVELAAEGRTIRSVGGFDVSMNGLRLPAETSGFAEGTACSVKIFLESSTERIAIEAKGSVVRSTVGGLAVRFDGIDLDGYHHLRQLILHNTSEPEKAEQEFRSHRGIRKPSARNP